MSGEQLTPENLIETAMLLVRARVRYAEQGRVTLQADGSLKGPGIDCGGVLLFIGHTLRLTTFELLGYAARPTGGDFERALDLHLTKLGNTGEARAGDVLAFDYGEGIQHVGLVTEAHGANVPLSRRFRVVHATRAYGVANTLLGFELGKYLAAAYRLPAFNVTSDK